MKTTLLIFAALMTGSLLGADLRLAWNPSTSADVTYVLYGSTNALAVTNLASSATTRTDCGTNTTAELDGLMPGQWQFAVTAETQPGVESDPSNVLLVEVATAPAKLRVLELQFSNTLTNWSNAGFFRLKMMP